MPKAHEIATELRKLADALDTTPDANMTQAWLSFYCESKEQFISAATILPRPFNKSETNPDEKFGRITIEHTNPAMDVRASVYKSLTCELVEPAKPAVYRCDPILSALEEAQLEGTDATA